MKFELGDRFKSIHIYEGTEDSRRYRGISSHIYDLGKLPSNNGNADALKICFCGL